MSNLDLLNDLDIVLMASGGPDLETLVRRGDAALNAHLETRDAKACDQLLADLAR